jgi:rhamnose utilization protein RhaD (predicted bifunctional aldolase and dehydrogenase)
VRERNVVGEEEEILYVKGSGWDLETIEANGFTPVRMAHLVKLAQLESLSDPQMVSELAAQVTRAGAPAPSVETILHAVIPHKFVDHTHADAVLAITNTDDGEARVRELYGDDVIIVPYVMPGFELARVCAKKIKAELKPTTIGMVLLKHGIFTFGATAEESYVRMISLVDRAENYLKEHGAWEVARPGEIGPIGPHRSHGRSAAVRHRANRRLPGRAFHLDRSENSRVRAVKQRAGNFATRPGHSRPHPADEASADVRPCGGRLRGRVSRILRA